MLTNLKRVGSNTGAATYAIYQLNSFQLNLYVFANILLQLCQSIVLKAIFSTGKKTFNLESFYSFDPESRTKIKTVANLITSYFYSAI